ncbi:MAG: Maf family protein [Planctomycetota bacterium]
MHLGLASSSVKRAELLRRAGYGFEVVGTGYVDADRPGDERGALELAAGGPTDGIRGLQAAEALVVELARRKAGAALVDEPWLRDGVVLSADTVAVGADGTWLGKPRDEGEAMEMLEGFVGREHAVVTGVAVRGAAESPQNPSASVGFGGAVHDRVETLVDVAWVGMGCVPRVQLRRYVESGGWRGKAGGYSLEERRSAGWPMEVRGDPGTVLGLPMQTRGRVLAGWGVRPGVGCDCGGG